MQKDILTINRDDWESEYHDLYFQKTGNNVNEKKKNCVFSVKGLRNYIQKNAEAKKENLAHRKDLDEIEYVMMGIVEGEDSSVSLLLSSPRAESARAVTGRRCPHSGEGEDFCDASTVFFFTKTAVTRKRKVKN